MEPFVHDAAVDMVIARESLLESLASLGDDDWRRYVPYGSRTVHDVLAHLAAADHTWALAARRLVRPSGEAPVLTPEEAEAAGRRAIERGRKRSPRELIEEMQGRRKLLLSLFELLEPKHLALALPSFGEEANSVRERIWLGYHDRLHADDIRRARAMNWHPPKLTFLPDVRPAVDALQPGPTLYVIYSVDPAAWELPSPNEGWTFREVLAHIASGDWVLNRHLRHLIETGSPDEWPDVDEGNAERIAERKFSTVERLVDEYLSMRHGTMLLLAQLKPEHLRRPIEFRWEPRPNQHTVLEYLLRFERHERFHRGQLRPAMKYLRAMQRR